MDPDPPMGALGGIRKEGMLRLGHFLAGGMWQLSSGRGDKPGSQRLLGAKGKTPGVGLVTTFHRETAMGVTVLFPEWEFDSVFIHPHVRGTEGEKHKVCVQF